MCLHRAFLTRLGNPLLLIMSSMGACRILSATELITCPECGLQSSCKTWILKIPEKLYCRLIIESKAFPGRLFGLNLDCNLWVDDLSPHTRVSLESLTWLAQQRRLVDFLLRVTPEE